MIGSTETQDDNASPRPRATAPRDEAHLFVVLECDRPGVAGARWSLEGVEQVVIGRGDERRATRAARDGVLTLHVELPGRSLSRHHARLVRWHDHWQLEDLDSRNGSFVNGERVERWGLSSGGLFEVGHIFLLLEPRLATPPETTDLDLARAGGPLADISSLLPTLHAEARAFARIADSRVPIMLRGETGTGKELFARAAHALSRSEGPFVALRCGAVGPTNLEGTHRGTLFLDEVTDLSLPVQAALLRVLDESVDLRVIAATNQSLEAAVARGSLRADLLARLAGYCHRLPPLRDHIVDLGSVVGRALSRGSQPRTLSTDAGRALLAYEWPYNAREVHQCLESASALALEGEIQPAHLPAAVTSALGTEEAAVTPADIELRAKLEAALQKAKGNIAQVARSMKTRPTQVYRWAKRFGLNPAAYRQR